MARFSYFQRLSAEDKRIYIRSDELRSVKVPDTSALAPLVAELQAALEAGKRVRTTKAANDLMRALCKQLGAPVVRVRVREVRPSWESGELHGLYTFADEDGEPPEIEVWMRTVAHKRVVKFKTFFRTLLHEVVHHLDASIYEMEESFHTEGFFARESSLFKQLMAATESGPATETETAPKTAPEMAPKTAPETAPPAAQAEQLSLFADVRAPARRRARRGE